jgi:two-component system LytT family sensor kinase
VTLALAVLGALAVMSTLQLFVYRRAAGEEVSLLSSFLFGLASWGPWALAAPFIIALGQAFDFRAGRRGLSALLHVLLLLVVLLPATTSVFVVGQALFGEEHPIPWREIVQQSLAGTRLHFAVVMYAGILMLARAVEARRTLGFERERAARSEALASQAQLTALAARLQPHFLFNALHAVGALIDEDPARARTMLAQLGDLLRDALADGGADVTLAEEFSLLERYLAIEAVRFTDRLRLRLDCDPIVAGQLVPRFLLQPLVENALHHGIAPAAGGGSVSVSARRDGAHVVIRVHNDGAPVRSPLRERAGLGATRERLRIRYGDGASLELRSAPGGGTEAVVAIPVAAAAAGAAVGA